MLTYLFSRLFRLFMNLVNFGEKEASVGECDELCAQVADEVEALLRSGEEVVLGLATGSTPLPLYGSGGR